MKVVVDRDYKIRNPGKWDGVWEVEYQSYISHHWIVYQEGRGYHSVEKELLEEVLPDAGNGS